MNTLDKIIYLISSKGITEKQFLNDMVLSSTTLSDWKSGRNKSFKKHIDKIADYFNVSTDYLLGKTDNPLNPNEEITFDDFTYAFYNESKELTEADKENLLEMARIFNKKRKERESK